jgi:hypothetical protein
MKYTMALVAMAMMGLSVLPTQAHHSYAPYDMTHPVTIAGTVKEFRWTNPHSWVHLMVPNDKGGADEWVIEGPSVTAMVRWGWRANSMKPGDKVKLIMAPMKDGSKGGSLAGAIDENGKIINAGRLPNGYAEGFEPAR